MVDRSAIIQWMDVDSGEACITPIDNIFQRYSHRISESTDDSLEINFNIRNIVKVVDWHGWSDVVTIRKKLMVRDNFFGTTLQALLYCGDDSPILTADINTLIPVYDPTKIIRGFHGETKYKFIVKTISELSTGDMIRIRRRESEFIPVTRVAILRLNPDIFGYEIETKSGFYNANNVYLWSRPTIPVDYCIECPNKDTPQCAGCYEK